MLIPIIGCIVAAINWGKKYVWWEMLLPTGICFFFIMITKWGVEKSMTSDTQYKGGIITEARYYEYWSTWVHKTCTERYACGEDCSGSGKDRHCSTRYCTREYDCSYCDENSEYWEAYDDQGHSWRISEEKYNALQKQWNSKKVFVELGRNIRYHFGCGHDGDMYRITWDGQVYTSEPSTVTESYQNKAQTAKSNFDLKNISKDEAKKYSLYEYPEISSGYKQPTLLGLDSFRFMDAPTKDSAKKLFSYFNGYYGPKRKMRLYVLLFQDKPIDVAIKQKYYWDGGNKNEMVICMNLDRTGHMDWVYPFSWATNKRIGIDIREDLMNLKRFDFKQVYSVIETSTESFHYRDFKEFEYLTIDPPTWEVWFVYLFTLGITIAILVYGYKNEFEQSNKEVDLNTIFKKKK